MGLFMGLIKVMGLILIDCGGDHRANQQAIMGLIMGGIVRATAKRVFDWHKLHDADLKPYADNYVQANRFPAYSDVYWDSEYPGMVAIEWSGDAYLQFKECCLVGGDYNFYGQISNSVSMMVDVRTFFGL